MKPKVVMGWPDGGMTDGIFTKSMTDLVYFELLNPTDRYEFLQPIRASGLYVTENRNDLIRQAQAVKADWLFQIDADESFNPDILRTVFRTASPERPVIVGVYANVGYFENKGFNIVDSIYAEREDGQYVSVTPPDNMQPFKIDAGGTGVFLTHMSVFDKVSPPWFWNEMIKLSNGVEKPMTEDFSFCRILRELGIPIWCEPMAEVTHWKKIPLVASSVGKFIKKSQALAKEMASR